MWTSVVPTYREPNHATSKIAFPLRVRLIRSELASRELEKTKEARSLKTARAARLNLSVLAPRRPLNRSRRKSI